MSRDRKQRWSPRRASAARRPRTRTVSSSNSLARSLRLETLEDRRLLAVFTVDTDQDVVDPTDGVTSLREAIIVANETPGADEITFDFGHDGPATIFLAQGELEITEALAIAGDGPELLTIDAQQQSRIFNITATEGDFAFEGMTLTGGSATGVSASGGAVTSSTDGTVLFIDAAVQNNSADSNGGGVAAAGEVGLVNSQIAGNVSVGSGGGVYGNEVAIRESEVSGNSTLGDESPGGGIYSLDDVLVSTSTISNNYTLGLESPGGGAYSRVGDVSVSVSIISGNYTVGIGSSGGAVFNAQGDVEITDSTVSGNRTEGRSSNGGGLAATTVQLDGSTVSDNQAGGDGGGIYGFHNGGVESRDSVITRNTAFRSGGGVHGYVVNLRDTEVSYNEASTRTRSFGGGVSAVTATLFRSQVAHNATGSGGGGGVAASNILINNSLVEQNEAAGRGGGIAADNIESSTTTFRENQSSREGGAIWASQDIELWRANLIGNNAIQDGGALFSLEGSIFLTETNVTDNIAQGSRGGGIAAANQGGDEELGLVHLVDSLVLNNAAQGEASEGEGGGGVFATHVLAEQGEISNNTSAGAGGGIYSVGPVELMGTRVANNHTIGDKAPGGGIYVTSGDVTVTDSMIRGNSTKGVSSYGGAIAALGLGQILLDGSTVTTNHTEGDLGSGGAIFSIYRTISAVDSEIVGNWTLGGGAQGGAIQGGRGIVDLESTVLSHNYTAGDGARGGGIAASIVRLERSTVTRNVTTGFVSRGGGISGSTVTIRDSEVSGNETFGDESPGGGVHAQGDLEVIGSTISGNSTEGEESPGGGVHSNGSIDLLESTVDGNSTSGWESSGGGIFAQGNVALHESAVSNNSTYGWLGRGGGLFVIGNFTVDQSFITSNQTHYVYGQGGGALVGGNAELAHSVVNNNATLHGNRAHGGGLYVVGDTFLYRSAVLGNRVSDQGISRVGGILTRNIQIIESIVSGNSSGRGAGGVQASGDALIRQSTISGNMSGRAPGGIDIFGEFTSEQSVITGNHAEATYGGGGVIISLEPAYISHTIISGNSATGGAADIRATHSSVAAFYSLIGDNSGTGLAEAPVGSPDENGNLIGGQEFGQIDPLLGPLADNGGFTLPDGSIILTHALLLGSPAIDMGDPNFNPDDPDGDPATDDALPFDQRGAAFARVFGGRVDIGAFELQLAGGALTADFDASGLTDGHDLLALQRNHGAQDATFSQGDATGEGVVNGFDLEVWEARFDQDNRQAFAVADVVDQAIAISFIDLRDIEQPAINRTVWTPPYEKRCLPCRNKWRTNYSREQNVRPVYAMPTRGELVDKPDSAELKQTAADEWFDQLGGAIEAIVPVG